MTYETKPASRPIPMLVILLVVLAVHGPLLFMQLPAKISYDTNFHIFFASHYAPGIGSTLGMRSGSPVSRKPLTRPLGTRLLPSSYVMGLTWPTPWCSLLLFCWCRWVSIVLPDCGSMRFPPVTPLSAACSLGRLASWFYNAGQLSTTLSAPLYLNALPYLYYFCRKGRMADLLKGVFLALAAACVHHVTLIFGAPLLALPTFVLAWMDAKDDPEEGAGLAVLSRAAPLRPWSSSAYS